MKYTTEGKLRKNEYNEEEKQGKKKVQKGEIRNREELKKKR